MKRFISILIIAFVFVSRNIACSESKQPQEILFRGIPWGTNYVDVENELSILDLWKLDGTLYVPTTTKDIMSDGFSTDFDYETIGMYAFAMNTNISVAGYTPTSIQTYFAYNPIDGILTHELADTLFYGAYYEFEPADPDAMVEDLIEKLKSLYGDYSSKREEVSIMNDESTIYIWEGLNSKVSIYKKHYSPTWKLSDTVRIAYVCDEGDEWLKTAEQAERNAALDSQNSVAGNGDTSGL